MVRPGDTLSAIAARNGTTWQELARINNLANPDLIFPGQFLVLRTDNPPPPPPSADVVTVRAGDTLSEIAARNGTTWQELARLNGLQNPNLIFPGQQLHLK